MSDTNNTIAIRFFGGHIEPGSVRAKDLADLIRSFEDSLIAMSQNEFGDLARSDLAVSLTAIENKSLGLQFQVSQPSVLFPAWRRIGSAIRNGVAHQLPSPVLVGLRVIARFIQRQNCQADLYGHELGSELIATITPETDLAVPPLMTGLTTLYGMIVRVGGSDPAVRIHTIAGETITCKVGQSAAMELGKRLYRYVGLQGQAEWDSETLQLKGFTVDEVLSYDQDASLTQTFDELREKYGHYFDDIDDVPDYVAQLRDDGPEV